MSENIEVVEKNSLDIFKKSQENMIATNSNAYNDYDYIYSNGRYFKLKNKEYEQDEIKRIIEFGSVDEQVLMSRHFFKTNGFYKRVILHYGTLLKYTGVLIPNVSSKLNISDDFVSKRYTGALRFVENMRLENLLTQIALKVFIEGTYFGLIQNADKHSFAVIDLPFRYCRTRFKDQKGNNIIEFNVAYFEKITNAKNRAAALSIYPKEISNYYKRWKKNKSITKWIFVDSSVGICFNYYGGRPLFLDMIPTIIDYDKALERNTEKELEEIKNILVQKIAHNFDGGDSNLLFEPQEAELIHSGTVGMLKKSNPNTAVVTTYADVELLSSKTTSESSAKNTLDNMKENIYSTVGVSSQIFASSNNLALESSNNNDLALVMVLGNQFSTFITNVINHDNNKFKNPNIDFKYTILPITWYNSKEYIDQTLKGATSGYSFILPALASGITQRDLVNLKSLENDLLKLHEVLRPIQTAYTQSGNGENIEETGRPVLDDKQKTDKTIQNQISAQGGSG